MTDRQTTKHKVTSAEKRPSLVGEPSLICPWDWDLRTNQVWRSDRFRQVFGYQSEQGIHSTDAWHSRIHPDDRETVIQRLYTVVAQGGEWSAEYRLMRADGSYTRVYDHGFTVSESGKVARMSGYVMDLTSQQPTKSSEDRPTSEPLGRLEHYLPKVLNDVAVGITVTNDDGQFIQVNQAFAQLTGYSSAELLNSTYSQLIHPDDLSSYQNQLSDLLSSRANSLSTQVRCLHKAGHSVWLRLQTTLLNDEANLGHYLVSLVQNISQDVVMRDTEQTMLRLVDHSLNFMGIADLSGLVIYLNKAARALVGLDETASLAGIKVADFYPPEQFAIIRDVAVPTLLNQGYWSGRVSIRHLKTGEIIPCDASGIRIDDPVTGKPIARGFTLRDIRAELAAQDAQRKLLTLVDNSVELMSILEMDGKNSYINKAGMAMLGFENEQHVQETPISHLHEPEHFSLVEEQVLPSVMSTGRWSGEMRVRHLKTGEIFPVFNNTIRIDDPQTGQPLAVGAVMRDMRPEIAAQQALIESESRFRSMIMQAPVAIGLLRGEQLMIESANEYMIALWGKSNAIIGKPLAEALPELDGQGFLELLDGVYQTGQPYYGYEVLARLYRKGQLEDAYFNFVYAPVRENNGHITGVMAVATEVTTQVEAKKELEESEKRFRNLILEAPMATAVYSGPDMVIQLANEAMLKLWGKDASVIGKKLRDALPELEGQPFHQLLDDVYTTGVAYQGTEDPATLDVDGKLQTFYFNFTYKPLRDASGQVYAILNMAVDITYQVTAKQQLTEIQESLQEAIDLAELAPWTSNVLTGEMTTSARVNDWLGVNQHITPDLVSRCIHEKDRAHVNQIIESAMVPTSHGKIDMEYTIVNQQTQQERILRTQARVIFNDQGAPYLIRGTSQDITAHRMTEQALEKQVQLRTEELIKSNLQLKRSNQELERYAYVASHDLQEPLRKIQLYSSLIRERCLEELNTEGRRHLVKIEESANRMSVLIKNILNFSRINHESGFVETVDLTTIIEGVVKDFEVLLAQKKGQVKAENLCVIPAIPLQMTQLFYNLIGNSLKFTKEGVPPVITISCRTLTEQELLGHDKLNPRTKHCLITVSDNGIGFDPAFGEKIFGLFQRLHHQQQYEGTGIGLSLCQRIVFNHQGEMWAESEEGKGATFYIILPMER